MRTISDQQFDEERALYDTHGAQVLRCRFDGPADGESAMKECSDLTVEECWFNLRYPFWHVDRAVIRNCEMTENCRAALWYDTAITIENSKLGGIKALRECRGVTLRSCDADSKELFWRCSDLRIEGGSIISEYPFFECSNVEIDGLHMKGKYSYQYTQNVTIRNAELDTKDAFWHSKNVTVYDSTIKGEYLAWYSENLHLVRCRIIGTQPLCYCKGLVLESCIMEETDLSFEYSEVRATVNGTILSVKNPIAGSIEADAIGEMIWDAPRAKRENTQILLRG